MLNGLFWKSVDQKQADRKIGFQWFRFYLFGGHFHMFLNAVKMSHLYV